ncbi:hypothetical protein MRX96_041204 [Rhipicephalus microplus]
MTCVRSADVLAWCGHRDDGASWCVHASRPALQVLGSVARAAVPARWAAAATSRGREYAWLTAAAPFRQHLGLLRARQARYLPLLRHCRVRLYFLPLPQRYVGFRPTARRAPRDTCLVGTLVISAQRKRKRLWS